MSINPIQDRILQIVVDNYVKFQFLSEIGSQCTLFIFKSETGKPPEGWESKRQIRNPQSEIVGRIVLA